MSTNNSICREEKDQKLLTKKRAINNDNNSENESYTSSFSENSESDIVSLMQKQLAKNQKKKYISVINIKRGKFEELECAKIASFIKNKEMDPLDDFAFPYMSQNDFNDTVFTADTNTFRKLCFYCPICKQYFRHYSLYYHIFQFHFQSIKEYLSDREIAKSCSRLMENEFEKIITSIELFSELAILYSSCDFRGCSEWRHTTDRKIKKLKNLNLENTYFKKTLEEAVKELGKILPVNENKNKTKKRTLKKKKIKERNDNIFNLYKHA